MVSSLCTTAGVAVGSACFFSDIKYSGLIIGGAAIGSLVSNLVLGSFSRIGTETGFWDALGILVVPLFAVSGSICIAQW
jgi:hypothetical protein